MSIFEHIDKRIAIGFLVMFLISAGVFFYWLSDVETGDTGLTVLPESPLGATLGRDLLSALATLKSTKLDTSVFQDPIFLSLKDFGVEISAQPIGRRNPFATFETGAPTVTSEKTPNKTPNKTPQKVSLPTTTGTPGSQPKVPPKTPVTVPGGFDIN